MRFRARRESGWLLLRRPFRSPLAFGQRPAPQYEGRAGLKPVLPHKRGDLDELCPAFWPWWRSHVLHGPRCNRLAAVNVIAMAFCILPAAAADAAELTYSRTSGPTCQQSLPDKPGE